MEWNKHNLEKASLLARYLQGSLTEEESAELYAWLAEDPARGTFLYRLEESKEESLAFLKSIDENKAWESVQSRIAPEEAPVRTFRFSRFWAAAAVIFMIGYVLYRYPSGQEKEAVPVAVQPAAEDFAPGSDKAFLTLDDGSVLILEDLPEGAVGEEAGVTLTKQKDELRYSAEPANTTGRVAFNKVSTPPGGYYRLVLPDSSRVWLNAASSIRFPVYFAGEERRVELTGEAFFEVAEQRMPAGGKRSFIVQTDRGNIEVLGTEFNVLAYAGEPALKTTLLRGAVKVVSPGNSSRILKPGQQAVLGERFYVTAADTEEATAWKNGYFIFENKPLNEILRELQRWYGVEIDEATIPPGKPFTIRISRDKSLSGVLKMLELSGDLHFEIRDKKIQITGKKK